MWLRYSRRISTLTRCFPYDAQVRAEARFVVEHQLVSSSTFSMDMDIPRMKIIEECSSLCFLGFATSLLLVLRSRSGVQSRRVVCSPEAQGYTKCELSAEQIGRYSRQLILKGFGCRSQEALVHSAVLVVGAGGIGSTGGIYTCNRISFL